MTPRTATATAVGWGVLLSLISPPSVAGQEQIGADEIAERSHLAYYYPGRDGRAQVTMRLISEGGKERVRRFTMLRWDERDGGEQRYFVYFYEPADVRRMVFMVWKHIERDDDRWLYVPAIDLVKRVAASDKRSSFVGSDFTYEDVSGRHPDEDRHTLVREELLDGRPTYVLKSEPMESGSVEFSYRLRWIDQETFLPLKEEYYDRRGELYRVFTAGAIREIGEIPTITHQTMRDLKRGHRTEVEFQAIAYDVGLDEDLFTERYLRRPPGQWIQ